MNNLVELLEADGFPMKYTSTTNGGEWHGPCPACARHAGDGGRDRLCCWPHHSGSDCGRAWCRVCDRSFDGIGYLRAQRGMSFSDACALLGVRREPDAKHIKQRSPIRAWQPRPIEVPSQSWRECAWELVQDAREQLFKTARGKRVLARIEQRRFLNAKTVLRAHLGIVEERQCWKQEAPVISSTQGDRGKMWIPQGLLLPTWHDGEIVALMVRRFEGEPRFFKVTGSSNVCMWWGPSGSEARAVVVVESALDAILLHQELPSDIAAVALGSASARPDADTAQKLKDAPLVLVGLDGDDAGARQAMTWWKANFGNSSRLAYPQRYEAKDPTELAVADGGTDILRRWVETGIKIAQSRWAGQGAPKINGKDHGVSMPSPSPIPAARSGTSVQEAAAKSPRDAAVVVSPSPDMRVTVVRGAAGVDAALRRIAEFDGVIGLDTETTPLPQFREVEDAALDPRKSRVRTLQAAVGDEVFVFDLNHVDVRALAPIAVRPWAGHNAVFDLKMLTHAGLECATPECTMLLANAIDNGRFSLRDLAAKHLDLELDKSERTSDWSGELSAEQIQYAARDAWATFRLQGLLAAQAERRSRMRLYGMMKSAQVVVAQMELTGIGFDMDAHARLVEAWDAELDAATADVRAHFGAGFNPNSSKQVSDWLQENLDADTLQRWPRTKAGNLSVEADSLAIRADPSGLAAITKARSTAHAMSQFGPSLASMVMDGRLHPHLMIAEQRTGRFSCSRPSLYNVNRDPRLRSVFTAGQGRILVAADYSQIQLRIAALLSRDPRLTGAMERGEDLHRLSTSLITGKSPDDVTAEERDRVKPANYGVLFNMGANTLWKYARSKYGVDMSIEEAKSFREGFFRAYPSIKAWHNMVRDQLQDYGKVSTPCGRWSRSPEHGELSLPTASAHIIQGGEAEVMLAALGRLPDALRGLDAVPMLCVHDEVIASVAEADVAAAESALQDAMAQGMRDVFPNAPLVGLVDAHHGPNWQAAKHGG